MNSDQDFQSIVQHDKYYIPGGDLCFQVDHVSFRVHKYFFERDSSYFAARLNAPTSPGAKPPGSSDATAIVLDEVNHEQFGKLLWVFYNPLYSIYEAPYSTWADILHMAHTWSFHGVKELAIRELENKTLPDVDRIRLYLDNGVDGNLLVPCYAALCEREKPLTLDEGRILGMEVALQIAAGREQVRATIAANGQRSPLTPTVKGKDLHGLIRELFQINDSPASPVFGDNEDPVMNTKPAAETLVTTTTGTGKSTPSQTGDVDSASGQAESGRDEGNSGGAGDTLEDPAVKKVEEEGAGPTPDTAEDDEFKTQGGGKKKNNKRGGKRS